MIKEYCEAKAPLRVGERNSEGAKKGPGDSIFFSQLSEVKVASASYVDHWLNLLMNVQLHQRKEWSKDQLNSPFFRFSRRRRTINQRLGGVLSPCLLPYRRKRQRWSDLMDSPPDHYAERYPFIQLGLLLVWVLFRKFFAPSVAERTALKHLLSA